MYLLREIELSASLLYSGFKKIPRSLMTIHACGLCGFFLLETK